MNQQMLFAIMTRNSADLEAIVAKVGLPVVFSLMPHILNIMNTVQQVQNSATGQPPK